MTSLQEKYELYKHLIEEQQDQHGFIYSDECDSLLFSGLVGCVPGVSVDIDAAKDANGAWHRRPTDLPECCSLDHWSLWERLKKCLAAKTMDTKVLAKIFETGGSTISRDMFMGLAWYAWANKRLDISESVIKYALSHKFIMGIGSPTRTFMTPGLLSTFAMISYKLGGPKHWFLRNLPQYESSKVTDFQAHLSVLHILLRRQITGDKTYGQDIAADQYKRQGHNPLFAYAAGDAEWAEMVLMNEKFWPNDRLPNNHDRSSNWLNQRDFGTDWLPEGGPTETFSGGDFLFVAWLLLQPQN